MFATNLGTKEKAAKMSAQQYTLCFINQSGYAGNACVYQDSGNVVFNQGTPSILAWMVTGANPSVQVNFKWQTDYNFVWFDYSATQTQQIIAANIGTGDAVPLSWNNYGYSFLATQAASADQLQIKLGASIPSINNAVAGIGMSGAGIFASPARPNTQSSYLPTVDAKLVYWIAFGAPFVLNKPINLTSLPTNPQQFSFPPGVYIMTAVLNSQNLWSTYPGPPEAKDVQSSGMVIEYFAGQGRVA